MRISDWSSDVCSSDLGARFFQDCAARHDDVAAAAVHLKDLEGLRQVHQRADVAHRADVDLRTRKERHGAAEVDGEAALDAADDDAFDAGFLVELDRKSVGLGKSVSVRVDLGGRRTLKKKNK